MLTNGVDDKNNTAHAGLLGEKIFSNSLLKDVDKAISNPQAVIQGLSGSNGQNCFAYNGDCVGLNDNTTIAKACGSGHTEVGWDDAGCGRKKCVSRCTLLAPCQWTNVLLVSDLTHNTLTLWEANLLSHKFCIEGLHLAWQSQRTRCLLRL